MAFIQKNSTSIISAQLLMGFCPKWSKDTVMMLYNLFSPEPKNSIYGKRVLDFVTLNKTPKIDDKYVDFEKADINGNNIKLSDYHENSTDFSWL